MISSEQTPNSSSISSFKPPLLFLPSHSAQQIRNPHNATSDVPSVSNVAFGGNPHSTLNFPSFSLSHDDSSSLRDNILRYYPSALDTRHKICIYPSKEDADSKRPIVTNPDLHFIDEDGTEVLGFLPQSLKNLEEAFYSELLHQIQSHSFALFPYSELLKSRAKKTSFDKGEKLFSTATVASRTALVFIPYMASGLLFRDTKILHSAFGCSNLCSALNTTLEYYRTLFSPMSCSVLLPLDRKKSSLKPLEILTNADHFWNCTSYLHVPLKECFLQLYQILGILVRLLLMPSCNHIRYRCVLLNLDARLKAYEINRNIYDEDTLKPLYKARLRLDDLLLQFKFLNKTNFAPILNINIDRGIVIADTPNEQTVYVDRFEAIKYLHRIYDSLNRKYANICCRFQIPKHSQDELISLANTSTNYHEMIKSMNQMIIEKEGKVNQLYTSAARSLCEGSTPLVEAGIQMFQNLYSEELKAVEIGTDFVKKVVAFIESSQNNNGTVQSVEKQPNNQTDNQKHSNASTEQMIPSDNKSADIHTIPDQTQQNPNASTGTTQGTPYSSASDASSSSPSSTSSSLDASSSASDTSSSSSQTTDSSTTNSSSSSSTSEASFSSQTTTSSLNSSSSASSQTTSSTTNSSSSSSATDTSSASSQTTASTSNSSSSSTTEASSTSQGDSSSSSSNQLINKVFCGIGEYFQGQTLAKEVALLKMQRDRLITLRKYNDDYVNLVKLYIELLQHDVEARTDFTGCFITERRTNEQVLVKDIYGIVSYVPLREYIVEIKKDLNV